MDQKAEDNRRDLATNVDDKSKRRSRARRQKERGVWFGLGMFGLVGWSVAIPAISLLALGIWIDKKWPTGYSWTLMLLVLGIALGCFNAWYWLKKESQVED